VPILGGRTGGRFHAAGSKRAPSALGGPAGHLLFAVSYSSPEPPLPSFVFTLAATGTTERKSGNWKAES